MKQAFEWLSVSWESTAAFHIATGLVIRTIMGALTTRIEAKTKAITIRTSRTKAKDMSVVNTVAIEEASSKELAQNAHIKSSIMVMATTKHKVVTNKSLMTRANTFRVKDSVLIRNNNSRHLSNILILTAEVTKVNNNPIISNNSRSGNNSNNIHHTCNSSLNSSIMAALALLQMHHLILT